MYCLLDCNNFFVSCERLFRPDLATKPTVVLSSNDGAVVARSQEIKELGIPMGVPHFKIKDILEENQAAVFSGNHRLYRDISRRVMAVLSEYADSVQQYSVDEAFFRLADISVEEAKEKLSELKQTVEKNVGVPVSIGAGPTMTIAKYASEREKRLSGVCVLQGEYWRSLTPEIPLSAIWGIGSQTAKSMREHNLNTVADLLLCDPARINKLFGVHGTRLLSELSEIPAHSPDGKGGFPHSIMSTRSFSQTVSNLAGLEEAVTKHVNEAMAELRSHKGKALAVRVILGTNRHSDWLLQGGSEEIVLSEPTNDTRVILQAALSLVKKMYQSGVPYKKAGIVLGRLQPEGDVQLNLFTNPEKAREDSKLMKVLDSLNNKWGDAVLSVGRIKSGGRFSKSKFRSPEYTTSWEQLRVVKAGLST